MCKLENQINKDIHTKVAKHWLVSHLIALNVETSDPYLKNCINNVISYLNDNKNKKV